MSVVGEYRRILSDLLALLDASSSPAARAFGQLLDEARFEHATHLSDAATRAASILDGDRGKACATVTNEIERERLSEQLDRLTAICRAVLGR